MEVSQKSTKTHLSHGQEENLKAIGRDFADPMVEVEPNQFRPTSPASAGKAQHYQTLGLMPQFEKSHDLQLLKMNVNQHMNKFGLSLLKYFPHSSNDTKVVNMIDNYGLFDKKKRSDDWQPDILEALQRLREG